MNAIIVSDLHMGSRYFQSEAFGGFLDNLPDIDELILNGDVLDRPQGDCRSVAGDSQGQYRVL